MSKDLTELREELHRYLGKKHSFRQGTLAVQCHVTGAGWHATGQQGGQWPRSRVESRGVGPGRTDGVPEVTEDQVVQTLKAVTGGVEGVV